MKKRSGDGKRHVEGSRDIRGGFEYFCFDCAFLAQVAGGKYQIVREGDIEAHKKRWKKAKKKEKTE